jgi:hypothetical protein
MADVAFSLGAALLSSVVTVLAAVKGVVSVACVFGALAVGFLLRAGYSYRRAGS